MQVLVSEIIKAKPTLQTLASEKLSYQTAYDLSEIINQVDSKLKWYDDERFKLLNKTAELNKDNGTYEFKDDKSKEEFAEEYQKLIETKVKLDFEPIDLKAEDIKISVSEINNIKFILNKGE